VSADQPGPFPPPEPDALPSPEAPATPAGVREFLPLMILVCAAALAVCWVSGALPFRVALVETLLLALAFYPVIVLTSWLELTALALLGRGRGLHVTSFGGGWGRPVWTRSWRGVKLYLGRERPWILLNACFAAEPLPSPRQLARLALAAAPLHAVVVPAALLCWYVCPWGRFVWLWLAVANVLAVGIHVRNALRLRRHGRLGDRFADRVRQQDAARTRLRDVGDTVGLSLCLLDAAVTWLALGNAEHADRLRAESETLAVPPDERFPYLGAYRALVRGLVARERGLGAAGREALDEARGAFEACTSRTGPFLVEWARGNLLLAEGDARQAVAVLGSLGGDPLLAEHAAVRVEVLGDCLCAQAALPESDPLAARLATYEAERRQHPLPTLDVIDLRVQRALAGWHARRQDWPEAGSAYEKALAVHDRLLAEFRKAQANRARFQQAWAALVEEERSCLRYLGKEDRDEDIPAPDV
jgi:hypothetical protein